MPVHNSDIAAIFDEIADLLEVDGANPFRVRAYRNAARTLRDLQQDVRQLMAEGKNITDLPGIGDDLAGKLHEICETGDAALLHKLHARLPHSLTELLKLPGLGPKKVRTLQRELHIQTLEQLHRAARDKVIRTLPGFGEKTELRILETLEQRTGFGQRVKLAVAAQYAEPLAQFLRDSPAVEQAVIAGSYRRAQETVGDIDILVTTSSPAKVINRFSSYDEIDDILSRGTTRASVVLKCGLQVDLRVVSGDALGAALHYFTGSKAHNIAIRRRAQARGLKVNEYGVFKGRARIAGNTEESVYRSVGLPYIAPELRENRGEIEAAQAGLLPKLVTLADLRGDLHAHTTETDGHNTLREMALAARERGFEYLAITEHSRRLTVAHGLDPRRLLAQGEAIDRLNEELDGIRLLKGIEVDILEDGELDLPDRALQRLDIVVGAVHSHFNLSRKRQTERLLRAMEHPGFTLLAHPSGRLIEQRDPYDVDMVKIIRRAKRCGCFLELNAHPERLDLLDTHCQLAREEGVLVSVNSDAHSTFDFDNLKFGIGQARRGWLEKDDVLNTRSWKELRKLLVRKS